MCPAAFAASEKIKLQLPNRKKYLSEIPEGRKLPRKPAHTQCEIACKARDAWVAARVACYFDAKPDGEGQEKF
jgi:hypothetical protein